MVDAGAGRLGCPFCGAQLGTGALYCGSGGAALVAQTRSGDDASLVVWRGGDAATGRGNTQGNEPADDPGWTFDPIKVGPDTCSGCESTAVFVVGGQAAVYSLEGCDDDWCFYETPRGIA